MASCSGARPAGCQRDALAPEPILEGVDLLSCIPQAIREHVLSGQGEPEHRRVTVAFVHFDGVDRLVSELGSDVVAYGLDHLVSEVQAACEKNGVTFLGSDVDKDGGKIILVSGAPQALGDDEERMLLTLRSIADAGTTIPVRIGVNSGPVFVGDVGPPYRRTYTVMGDAVNLAARVMAKAQPGEILATEPVLRASGVRFDTGALDPFMVKGRSTRSSRTGSAGSWGAAVPRVWMASPSSAGRTSWTSCGRRSRARRRAAGRWSRSPARPGSARAD